jgi:hypothetical protein
MSLTDDELADRWERQALGGSGVSHLDHLRIGWVLVGRHGAAEAEERLVDGTRRGCDHYGVPERFDEALTRRWSQAIAAAWRDGESFEAFLERSPELRDGRLFGVPG